MLPCLSFRTVVSRKLTELVDISCVNLIDGAALFRWSMNSVKESMSPFHIYIYIYIYVYILLLFYCFVYIFIASP